MMIHISHQTIIASIMMSVLCLVSCQTNKTNQSGQPIKIIQSAPTIIENHGTIEFEFSDEKTKVFYSVNNAIKAFIKNLTNEKICDNLVVFDFTNQDGTRNQLCDHIEREFRNKLKSQVIDPENYNMLIKIKQFYFNNDSFSEMSMSGLPPQMPHCMLTGNLILEENNKLIRVLVFAFDTLTGKKIFSGEFALDYRRSDIVNAYNTLWDYKGIQIALHGDGAEQIANQFKIKATERGFSLKPFMNTSHAHMKMPYYLDITVNLGQPTKKDSHSNPYMFEPAMMMTFQDKKGAQINTSHAELKDSRFHSLTEKPQLNAIGTNSYMIIVNELVDTFYDKLEAKYPFFFSRTP